MSVMASIVLLSLGLAALVLGFFLADIRTANRVVKAGICVSFFVACALAAIILSGVA